MPKAKTHSALKKRIKQTGSGKFITAKTAKRHLLQNKTSKAKGRDKYGKALASSDVRKVRKALKLSS